MSNDLKDGEIGGIRRFVRRLWHWFTNLFRRKRFAMEPFYKSEIKDFQGQNDLEEKNGTSDRNREGTQHNKSNGSQSTSSVKNGNSAQPSTQTTIDPNIEKLLTGLTITFLYLLAKHSNDKKTTNGITVEPIERGGRPRKKGRTKKPISAYLHPEIVCWKKECEWIVGVVIPDDILSTSSISIYQGNTELSEDNSRPRCYLLYTLNTPVKVVVNQNDKRHIHIPLNEKWILFKLSGSDLDHGRKVTQISSGLYLVIVPDAWERDEEKSGTPPIMPEPVFLHGYKAHFFEIDDKSPACIAFRNEYNKPIVIRYPNPQFYLEGQRIPDANERMGPLFGVEPPQICIKNGQWSDVKTIVVGQEGGGQQRWRQDFKPNVAQLKQNLPQEILKMKAGWYFIRFYDMNNRLIDSLDFRFVAGLKNIIIPPVDPSPSSDGYLPQTVEIVHDDGYNVTKLDNECSEVKVERSVGKTILSIPPMPQCDCTHWLIKPQNNDEAEVEFTILIERIWWALGNYEIEPDNWSDRVITLRNSDIRSKSDVALWLRFPKQRWLDSIFVGFEENAMRKYNVLASKKVVSIPIRDFCGHRILESPGTSTLFVDIGQGRQVQVCRIITEVRCTKCKTVFATEDEVLQHFEKEHIEDYEKYFEHLTYGELQELFPELPYKIYLCPYCGNYVDSDNVENPTSAICNHQEYECEKVKRIGGKVEIKFSVITDVEEIRKYVIKNLPWVYKCKLCGEHVGESTSMKFKHLSEKHKSCIYELF